MLDDSYVVLSHDGFTVSHLDNNVTVGELNVLQFVGLQRIEGLNIVLRVGIDGL